ncbi:hypothetical protein CJ030_MR7G011378 [Morella rubra]|uniref:Uncharacterized protein n=1 Tax=Morella rubra TaxID=262757 RepID=A0A6A1V5E0_9ROSI|nr:hypothetical protein CJ030_MR7G011378 [Morella rubra]
MGDHPKNPQFQNPEDEKEEEEEEEEEEALSLSDLPLNQDDDNYDNNNASTDLCNNSPRSRPESPELFEFSSDFSFEICPANDIIFGGKLMPFKEHFPPAGKTPKAPASKESQRRSWSLYKLQSPITRSNSSDDTLMRGSRSLDCRELHRRSHSMASSAPEMERSSSVKSMQGKSDMALKKAAKPRWYSLMFGKMKFPPKMELSDIKNRQVRQNPPSTLFPVNHNSDKGSWRLLRALSCKDHGSVPAKASFSVPQI